MSWISHIAPGDPGEAGRRVVRRPRDVDAIGAALAAAFEKPAHLPDDWVSALKALNREP